MYGTLKNRKYTLKASISSTGFDSTIPIMYNRELNNNMKKYKDQGCRANKK